VHLYSFDETSVEYARLNPDSPFFHTWIPKKGFIGARSNSNDNLSITRSGEKTYGFAFGERPIFDPQWESCSVESKGLEFKPENFEVIDQWDCYWAPTIDGENIAERSSTDLEIEKFLQEHAPNSSVMPGNNEILQWLQIHREGELLAVAALCRWESGKVVISSVATHSGHRGEGIGKELMRRVLIAGGQLGEKYLSLGVMHENESAQSLYRSMGFTLMHNFTFCERR
jgi:ribosomal protein S18 acetylase RimI-like enzyme